MDELNKLPLWLWIVIIVTLLCQSTWLFIDSRKRRGYYWFWGLWGLIQFPWPLILYWIIVRKQLFRKSKMK